MDIIKLPKKYNYTYSKEKVKEYNSKFYESNKQRKFNCEVCNKEINYFNSNFVFRNDIIPLINSHLNTSISTIKTGKIFKTIDNCEFYINYDPNIDKNEYPFPDKNINSICNKLITFTNTSINTSINKLINSDEKKINLNMRYYKTDPVIFNPSNKIINDTINNPVSINELDDKKDIHDLLEYIRKVKEE